jgi:hypothetical protein
MTVLKFIIILLILYNHCYICVNTISLLNIFHQNYLHLHNLEDNHTIRKVLNIENSLLRSSPILNISAVYCICGRLNGSNVHELDWNNRITGTLIPAFIDHHKNHGCFMTRSNKTDIEFFKK